MAFDQLLAALEREAGHTAEQVLAEARAEADRLTASSEEKLARRRDSAAAAATQEQHAELERAISAVALGGRRETLLARERCLLRIFDAVRTVLPKAIDQSSYRKSLPERVAAALACFGDAEPTVLRCPPSLVASFQSIIVDHPMVSLLASPEVGSGFHLSNVDGSIDVDDTLETWLEHAHASLARKALQQLERSA